MSKAGPAGVFVKKEWVTHPDDTILISSAQCAHRPGWCDHMTEDDVRGTVEHQQSGDRHRGNLGRRTVRQCSDCEANLSQT